MMSETDVQIARSLGKEASFSNLRVAESAVCAVEPASSQLPRESTEKNPVSDEVMHQLSTFDSESDEYDLSPPPKKSRSNQQQLVEEQKELLRFQRLVLDKEYALCSKLDALLDKISIKLEVVNAAGTSHRTTSSRTYEEALQLGGDPNIEESVI
ncbi:unnamed protein product [Cylicocyclus nassatus]|uniref:Uncharacterized protein n=1 Tax=Cylicocyclus nassatus TaxID=53992 RepID=A0AA36M9V5_CYLNA|nr:unnamed protein product [Cylicocyclus nassatus]